MRNLDFLKYDWRGTALDAQEIAAEGESQTMSRFPTAAMTIILEPLEDLARIEATIG